MTKELQYFTIEGGFGGNQDWLKDPMMNLGGCAALAACESCIYFDLYKDTKGLYPYDKNDLNRQDYIVFAQKMKPYLRPRLQGISRLEIFIDGFAAYLSDRKIKNIHMDGFSGDENVQEAIEQIKKQIDEGFLIPCLTLKHKNPIFDDYVWHWFLLAGYREEEDHFYVKAITYGNARWLDFKMLWNTGFAKKGGLILYQISD